MATALIESFSVLYTTSACLQDKDSLPAPIDDQVQCIEMPGGMYAVRSFSGVADQKQAQEQLSILRESLAKHKIQNASDTWTLARYNDPSTKGPFRRNEVMIAVKHFDIWGDLGS